MKKALLRWMNFILVLPLAASVNFARADDGFYVIAVGKRAKRTILVSPQSTQTASGTALLNAVNGITDASATNPYLVIIEPGVYDIGANSLQMKQYVDLQGSDGNVTKITGNAGSFHAGVLRGADNAGLRFLTVENTGGETYTIAVYNNSSSPSMNNVTVTGSGVMDAYGVVTDVTGNQASCERHTLRRCRKHYRFCYGLLPLLSIFVKCARGG